GFALGPVDPCPVDEGGLVGAIPNLGGGDVDAGESIGEIHRDPGGGPGVGVRRVDVCAGLGRVVGGDDDEVFEGVPGGEVVGDVLASGGFENLGAGGVGFELGGGV